MVVYSIRNYGISLPQFGRFEEYMRLDLDSARGNPESKSVLLLGDFSIEPQGYRRHAIPKPAEVGGAPGAKVARTRLSAGGGNPFLPSQIIPKPSQNDFYQCLPQRHVFV